MVPITFVKPSGVGRLCLDIVCWRLPYPGEGFCFWDFVGFRWDEIWDRGSRKKADDDFIRREIVRPIERTLGLNQAKKTSYRSEGGYPGKREIDRPGGFSV